jgi:predicted Zn-dependent peptidase
MIVNLKSQTELSGFYIVYEGSTNLEKKGIYGISHLMEHCQCKNFDHLREDLEKDGIDWNAMTSQNEIIFYFTGLEDNLKKYRHLLVDLITDFKISKEQFENERNIVLQEYTGYFASQTESHQLNLNRKLFNDYDPIGLRQDLESLKFMDCLNFFELQYASPSKIINVSPSTKFKSDIQFAERKIDKVIKLGPYNDVTLEKMNDFGDKASLIMMSPLVETNFNYITFINAMLSSGLSSPLYEEVREKRGLVYYIRCGQSRMNKQGITTISTQTSSANVDQVYDAVRSVLKNPDKYLTQERFDTIKDSYIIKMKKDKINRYDNVNRWINPEGWSIKEILDTVTLDKIREVYDNNFDFDKFYLSYDKEEFGSSK